jgi:hypothetical protein
MGRTIGSKGIPGCHHVSDAPGGRRGFLPGPSAVIEASRVSLVSCARIFSRDAVSPRDDRCGGNSESRGKVRASKGRSVPPRPAQKRYSSVPGALAVERVRGRRTDVSEFKCPGLLAVLETRPRSRIDKTGWRQSPPLSSAETAAARPAVRVRARRGPTFSSSPDACGRGPQRKKRTRRRRWGLRSALSPHTFLQPCYRLLRGRQLWSRAAFGRSKRGGADGRVV